jgi:hypothetical protein
MACKETIPDTFGLRAGDPHTGCLYDPLQASVLLTYEGTATRMEDAKPQVHLIDFAHTYHSNGEQDTNFLQGLDSLISILNSLGQ